MLRRHINYYHDNADTDIYIYNDNNSTQGIEDWQCNGSEYPYVVEQKKWFDLFAKLINEQGGWKIGADTYKVDMIIYDSAGDPVKAKNYLEKLVLQDGVKFILGSPTNNPATDAEVTEPNKVICLGVDVTGTSADPKIQYYYTPPGLFFRWFYVRCLPSNGA